MLFLKEVDSQEPTQSLQKKYLALVLEHIKKFCSRSLRRRFGARSIEYWLYTPSLCASAPGTASTTKIFNDALKWL
ncbi:MAG: hypothetical protein K2W99_05900 [Chthoniobacterales bacterium]|nr:hypothetical protein [Chthoniobacterales bacterium]